METKQISEKSVNDTLEYITSLIYDNKEDDRTDLDCLISDYILNSTDDDYLLGLAYGDDGDKCFKTVACILNNHNYVIKYIIHCILAFGNKEKYGLNGINIGMLKDYLSNRLENYVYDLCSKDYILKHEKEFKRLAQSEKMNEAILYKLSSEYFEINNNNFLNDLYIYSKLMADVILDMTYNVVVDYKLSPFEKMTIKCFGKNFFAGEEYNIPKYRKL